MDLHMEWNVICRVCLQEGEMRSIYEKDDSDILLSDKIMLCSSIKIDKDSNLPEQICLKCVEDLNTAYNFRVSCESSSAVLEYFLRGCVGTDTVTCSINGGIYKFKPPEGLNVRRVRLAEPKKEFQEESQKYDSDIKIKSECDEISESYEELYSEDPEYIEFQDESYEIHEIKKESLELKRNVEKSTGRPKVIPIKSTNNSKLKTKNEKGKPLICEICGNIYKQKHALETHMRRHRNEKNFVCEICQKAFVLNVELNCHMRTHTGQKPYACNYCDRRFADFGSRIKHERTHTGERPYACETCGKAFAYSYGLTSHMLTHTGEKPYECEKCGKRFAKKHHLRNHLNTHLKQEKRLAAAQKETIETNVVPTGDENSSIFYQYSELIKDMTSEPNIDQYVEEVDVIEQSSSQSADV